jgi:hypothetical protein
MMGLLAGKVLGKLTLPPSPAKAAVGGPPDDFQTEQGFHDCPSANSTRNRAVSWRDGDADNHGTLDDFVGRANVE